MKFDKEKLPTDGDYLCYWKQDDYNFGYEIFTWKIDRWLTRSMYNHNGTNYVIKYFKLPIV